MISALNLKVLSLFHLQEHKQGLREFFLFYFYFAVIGFAFGVILLLFVLFCEDLFSLPLCGNNQCFVYFFGRISSVVVYFDFFGGVLLAIGALGVLFVALLNYLSSDRTYKFSNYISHLGLFNEYFCSEVSKRDSLSISSFDVYRIYALIFSVHKAKDGVIEISSEYQEFISRLNAEVERSNAMASNATGGSFRYLEHQGRIKGVLASAGFEVQFQPKKDFYEIETQLISLIDALSISFCNADHLRIADRRYR